MKDEVDEQEWMFTADKTVHNKEKTMKCQACGEEKDRRFYELSSSSANVEDFWILCDRCIPGVIPGIVLDVDSRSCADSQMNANTA